MSAPNSYGRTYPFIAKTKLDRQKRYSFIVPIRKRVSITYSFVVPDIDIYLAVEIPYERFKLKYPVIEAIDVTPSELYCRQESIEVIEAEWSEHAERTSFPVECIATAGVLYQPRATEIVLSPLSQVRTKERVLESDALSLELTKKNAALVNIFVESTDENEYVVPSLEAEERKQETALERLIDVSVCLNESDRFHRYFVLIESENAVYSEIIRPYDEYLVFLPTLEETTIKENSLDTELMEQDLGQIYAFEIYEHILDTASDTSEQELSLSEMDKADASLIVFRTEESKPDEVKPLSSALSTEETTADWLDTKVFTFDTESIESSRAMLSYATISSIIEQNDLFETKVELLEAAEDKAQTVYTTTIVYGAIVENSPVSLVTDIVDIDTNWLETLMIVDNTIIVSFNDIDRARTDEEVEAAEDKPDAAYIENNFFDGLLNTEDEATRLYDGHLAFLPTWGESTIKEISLDTELIEQDSGQIYAFEIYEHMLDTASEVSEQELELSEMDEADASLNVIQIEEMKLEEAQPLSILLSEEAMLSQTIPYATIGSEVEQIDLFKTKIEVLETTKDDVQTVYTSSIVFSSLIETNTVSVAFTVNTDVIQYEAMMDTDNTIVVSFDDIDHVYTDEAVEIINDESIAVAYAHDDCIDSLLQSNETLSCEQSISADHDELSFFEKTKEDYEVIIADENTLTDDHTVFEADVNETDGAEMHAFEVHEHVTDTFESDHSVPTDLICSDKLSNASEYVIDKLPLGSFTSSQILDMHAHGLEHVTHERIIGAEVSPIDNMSAGSTIAVELSESNTAISISVFESSESIFDQSVSVSDIEASESLLITFDNQPIITAEIHESEETESVPILLSNLHKTEISDAISVISTDTTSLTPMEWSADIPAAIEDTDANKNVIKEKKRIWLIPMRANFWNKWFTKKTR